MERFQIYVNRKVERKNIDGSAALREAGFVPRYLPDAFEDFDEMEFLLPFEGDKKLVLSIALEEGGIKRILIGWVGPDDPDDMMRSLDKAGLKKALDLQGGSVSRFLDEITGV